MVRVCRVFHRFAFVGSELHAGLRGYGIVLEVCGGVVAFAGVVVGAGGAGAGQDEGEDASEEVHGSWLVCCKRSLRKEWWRVLLLPEESIVVEIL